MSYLVPIVIYICAFYCIWFGANLIVNSITKFSRRLRISTFSASFFVLGILTSIPEFAVGLTSINSGDPEVFVGNLVGGTIIIFLFIIPLLAILGNGIHLSHKINTSNLMVILFSCITPSLLVADKVITFTESIILIGIYATLFFLLRSQKGVSLIFQNLSKSKAYTGKDLAIVILGVLIVFISSHYILEQTLYFSKALNMPPIIISVLLLSFGTNMPELSLAVKGVLSGRKDVALGNYLGSAAANTLLMGVLTLINKGRVQTTHGFSANLIFVGLGLGLFFAFTRSKNDINRREGMIMILVYFLFVAYWFLQKYITIL